MCVQRATGMPERLLRCLLLLTLAPKGQSGCSRAYGCKFRWAAGYEGVRQVLVEEGGIDVHAVPGMTLPSDLPARFALRTNWEIQSVEAEFPATTRIMRWSTPTPRATPTRVFL